MIFTRKANVGSYSILATFILRDLLVSRVICINWVVRFTIMIIFSCVSMSCVESTIRKLRKIRFSENIGLRVTFAVGHTLLFIAWIKFEFFIIFWSRHVFTITFVIIRYTKNFQNIFLSAQWIVIPARMVIACSLERRWIAEGTRHRLERKNS